MNKAKAEYLNIAQLRPFEGHPFQVREDEEMDQLMWSILSQGLLTPLVVRPLENDQYEVISGHRRLLACQKAGIDTVPALVYPMSRDEAMVILSSIKRSYFRSMQKSKALEIPAAMWTTDTREQTSTAPDSKSCWRILSKAMLLR